MVCALLTALGLAVALSGCSSIADTRATKDLVEETLLEQVDGATDAIVGSSVDGFERYLSVTLWVESGTMTEAELVAFLRTMHSLDGAVRADSFRLTLRSATDELGDVSEAREALKQSWPEEDRENSYGFLRGSYDSEVNAYFVSLDDYFDYIDGVE